MREVESSSAGSPLGRSVLELCLGKEAETCKVLEIFLTMVSTESSIILQKFIWQDNLCTENASAGERPVSSLAVL